MVCGVTRPAWSPHLGFQPGLLAFDEWCRWWVLSDQGQHPQQKACKAEGAGPETTEAESRNESTACPAPPRPSPPPLFRVRLNQRVSQF